MSMSNARKRLESLRTEIAIRFDDPKEGCRVARTITDVEQLLVLARRHDEPHRANKANLLLCNYHLLQPESFGEREHVLQMARRHLRHLSSGYSWTKKLEAYMDEETSAYRMFDVVDGDIIRRQTAFGEGSGEGERREDLYMACVLEPTPCKTRGPQAEADVHHTYWTKPEREKRDKPRSVSDTPPRSLRAISIPPAMIEAAAAAGSRAIRDIPHKGVRPAITFTLDELISAAREMGELTGQTHLAVVLETAHKRGLFKRLEGATASAAEGITIERAINMVGIVGSGKSVFADVLTYACAKRGLRVATVHNSISDVIESFAFFESLGVEASPLISKNRRLEHLDELASKNGQMLLDNAVARYLEAPCLLDGMAEHADVPTGYGDCPCFGLKDPRGNRRACPFFDICPAQSMARAALSSRVVITTPAGFALTTVGAERQPFFEHALADFDLVIFDEADRVQSQLDALFAPSESFGAYIRESADAVARALKRPPREKVDDPNLEYLHDLRGSSDSIAKALSAEARKPAIAEWKELKGHTFTTLSLLEMLKGTDETPEDQCLPDSLIEDLQHCIDTRGDYRREDEDMGDVYLRSAIHAVRDGANDAHFRQEFDSYLKQRGVELSPTLRERLAFTLKAVSFDGHLHDLDHASDMLAFRDESIEMLYDFIHASTSRQAPYLPASPVGNLCGFKITDEHDIQLYRQFGTGRAFMTALPWLDTDEQGNPCGPHALMLSGSSYEPGCLQFHINQPVDYLLDAQPEFAEFLTRSTVRDLELGVAVSGSGPQRGENLRRLLKSVVDTLVFEMDDPRSHKALVIVNSYEQAAIARDTLQGELRRRGRSERVCALVSNREDATPDPFSLESNDVLPRAEVYRFAHHEARILVAPAMAIERGFNIVDDCGHSAIDTLVFAVRPMGIPQDLVVRFKRMVGLVCEQSRHLDSRSPSFEREIREGAWRRWVTLERDEALSLRNHASFDDYLTRDIVATLMVLLVQIFGRLARVRDLERRPPHIYFADSAFAGNQDPDRESFRTLELLIDYMGELIGSSGQPAVAQALYGPFFSALTKGIRQ